MKVQIDEKNYVEIKELIEYGVAGKVYKLFQEDSWEAGNFLLGELVTAIVIDGETVTGDLKMALRKLPMKLGTKAFQTVTRLYQEQMYDEGDEKK